jgi:hypothetical protein
MQKPTPSAAHDRLTALAGEWHGEERIHPSPWDPIGGVAIVRVHNVLALDGFAVVQDYEQERNGGVHFRGHGVFRWDEAGGAYVLHWFDSAGLPPSEFRGDFDDGGVLTLSNRHSQGWTRAVFEFRSGNHYDYRLDVSPDGTAWQPFMTGGYARRR